MNENERKTLQRERLYILDNLALKDIKDVLIARRVFTTDMVQEFEAETTDRNRTRKMLEKLETRGPDAFGFFCDILSKNHSWVKEKLEATYREECNRQEENNFDWLDNLGENRRIAKVTDAELSQISREIGNEWVHLASLMGFNRGRIEQYQSSHQYSVYQQASKMLSDWKAKCGGRATIENLVTIMRQAEIDEGIYRPVLEGTNQLS